MKSKQNIPGSARRRAEGIGFLARDRLACSLYEHFSEVEALLGHHTEDAAFIECGNR